MKKILSCTLILAMLFSLAAVLAIPTAAIDGNWHTIADVDIFQEDYDGTEYSNAGYEYTDDGFHTIATNAWNTDYPYISVQTKEKVDLKDGVYFEVRIDKFTYLGDKWFNMHIWDSQGIVPGSNEPKYGSGVQELMRPGNSADPNDPTKCNGLSGINGGWYINQFTMAGNNTPFAADQKLRTEDGDPIIMMTVTWDGKSYALDINGAKAPQAVIDFMNQKWGGEDSEAYIGIDAMNSTKGGACEFTITKFGTSKAEATTPMGDDKADPVDASEPYAEIAPADTIPENEPAIFINADKENSSSKGSFGTSGARATVNDDFSIHMVAERDTVYVGPMGPKRSISYDIADFPIAIALTRNYCTCANDDGSCDALETAFYYIAAGDVIAASNEWKTAMLEMSYNSYTIPQEDGSKDTYLYFYCDFSEEFDEPMSGRINSIRLDLTGIDLNTEGANAFDFMFVAFFRTVEEAEAYVLNYVTELGWVETEEPTTEDVTEVTTEETAATTEETTAEKLEDKTEEPEASEGGDETQKAEDGCASVVCFSAIAAVVAIGAIGTITFRKKRD